MEILMHSFTFRGYPLREAFVNAQRFGWDGIELQPCHFNRDAVDTELPAAAALGKEYGAPIRCLDFGGDFINEDPSVAEAAVRQMEREIEACSQHGVQLMNGCAGSLKIDRKQWEKNGSALAEEAHYERAADAFRHLGKIAAGHGIRIVFEIHMNMVHDTVASTIRLLDLIGLDNVQANPDPGNMFCVSPDDRDPGCLDALRGRIGYFHMKNVVQVCGAFDFSVKLGDGHIDYYRWVDKMVSLDFNGPVCIEYCGAGDPHVPAELDIRYLRNVLEWRQ
jgi:sugar phosphate isomerase/epimerase